jgi:hypothetical protein
VHAVEVLEEGALEAALAHDLQLAVLHELDVAHVAPVIAMAASRISRSRSERPVCLDQARADLLHALDRRELDRQPLLARAQRVLALDRAPAGGLRRRAEAR